jgi:hypothetical protein
MNARTQITIDPELQDLAHAKASELGISFAEYVRRLLAQDLASARRKVHVSAVFDLVDEGPPTNIARDKDKMVAEAVWQEHLRKTSGKRRPRARAKTGSR